MGLAKKSLDLYNDNTGKKNNCMHKIEKKLTEYKCRNVQIHKINCQLEHGQFYFGMSVHSNRLYYSNSHFNLAFIWILCIDIFNTLVFGCHSRIDRLCSSLINMVAISFHLHKYTRTSSYIFISIWWTFESFPFFNKVSNYYLSIIFTLTLSSYGYSKHFYTGTITWLLFS